MVLHREIWKVAQNFAQKIERSYFGNTCPHLEGHGVRDGQSEVKSPSLGESPVSLCSTSPELGICCHLLSLSSVNEMRR